MSVESRRMYGGIEAVLFDFGGTLDADGISWKDRFFPLYQKAGLNWSQEEFEKYFYASDDFLTAKKLAGETYFQTLKWQVSLVLKNGGLRDKRVADRVARTFWKDSRRFILRNKKVLVKLKRNYRLAVVSNFYGNLIHICREVRIAHLFDAIVDSNVAGYTKPDPRIFFCALNQLKIDPRASLFVGDSISRDMQGAKAIGMRHIWLRGKTPKNVKPCCSEELAITSFLDLKDLLL